MYRLFLEEENFFSFFSKKIATSAESLIIKRNFTQKNN